MLCLRQRQDEIEASVRKALGDGAVMSEKQTKRARRRLREFCESRGTVMPPKPLAKLMVRAMLRQLRGK